MTVNEYQNLAMRTLNPELDKKDVLINSVMGLCGESGEAIDIVKKWLAHGHPLDREKLIKSLTIATAKRPVKMVVLEDMVEDVVQDLKNQFRREVTSYEIGEMVLQRLKTIDKVAYIRFASVYKDFNDIDSFVKIISELNNEKQ